MNSKMTTNSQLSTYEPKRKDKQSKQKLSKQQEQEQNQRNGDHMEVYQQGEIYGKVWELIQAQKNGHHMEGFQWRRGGEEGGKGTGKKHNW